MTLGSQFVLLFPGLSFPRQNPTLTRRLSWGLSVIGMSWQVSLELNRVLESGSYPGLARVALLTSFVELSIVSLFLMDLQGRM